MLFYGWLTPRQERRYETEDWRSYDATGIRYARHCRWLYARLLLAGIPVAFAGLLLRG